MSRSCNGPAAQRVLSAVAALLSTLWMADAHAAESVGMELHEAASACREAATDFMAQPANQPLQVAAQSSKSVAILGGQVSALEQIRLAQQSDAGASELLSTALAGAGPALAEVLSPAVGGTRFPAKACTTPALAQTGAFDEDDFLASKRLGIGQTAFDRDWQRVSGDRISVRRYRKLMGSAANDGFSALRSVNGWVNQAIAFTEDLELFSRADHWAGAATTLRLRRGDCEDIAVTKMQLLAAAGIPREDMILTIARDLVRNADHAVLIVRYDGHYYMLDNASDEVLDASPSHDYRPILSFGSGQTWLHGY